METYWIANELGWVKAMKIFDLIPLALSWAMLWLAGRQKRAQFRRRDDGQDLVEYALIVAVVALALATAVGAMSQSIGHLFDGMTEQITGVGQAFLADGRR